MKKLLIPLIAAIGAIVLGVVVIGPFSTQRPPAEAAHSHEPAVLGQSTGPASQIAATGDQLLEATKQSSKFGQINAALGHGYENINVFFPNMGCHYLNSGLLDGTFDHKHPELLVYAEESGKAPLLVAVEYAVPISESPNGPPDGFPGDHDVWTRADAFGLWTLHAWIYLPNPDGVFAPDNPLVTQATPECGLGGPGNGKQD